MSSLIYIFSFIITSNFNFCTCAPIVDWRKTTNLSYEIVDDIFIGEVISISENSAEYKFVVCEVFKGDLKLGETIIGINPRYCYPVVTEKGEWLFFGTYTNKFKQNNCGLTTNIAEPLRIPPPPPPPNSDVNREKERIKWKKKSRKIVQEQIEILRQLKTN